MSIYRGFSDGPPFHFRYYPLLLLLVVTGCASVPARSAALDPYIVDLEVPPDQVLERIGILVQNDPFGSHLEGRRSALSKLTTGPINISIKRLKQWAKPHGNAPGGKPLRVRMFIEFQLLERVTDEHHTRVVVRPVFEVYLSSWGDRRQWVEWMSNGVVEAIIKAQLLQDS